MKYIQLFAQKQDETGIYSWIEIDTFPEEPIKFTKSIQTLEDPQAVVSNYSKTFRVPNTPPNGKYFKGVFNVNSVTYNATKKASAYININGAYFTSGNIRLNSIITDPQSEKIERRDRDWETLP